MIFVMLNLESNKEISGSQLFQIGIYHKCLIICTGDSLNYLQILMLSGISVS